MHNGYDQSDDYRHENDRFVARSEPDDDERSECDFGKCVHYDDVRFQYASYGIAPPQRKRNQDAEYDCKNKSDDRFEQRYADMVEQCALVVKRTDRLTNARRGTYDERIDQAEHGRQFPKAQKQH